MLLTQVAVAVVPTKTEVAVHQVALVAEVPAVTVIQKQHKRQVEQII